MNETMVRRNKKWLRDKAFYALKARMAIYAAYESRGFIVEEGRRIDSHHWFELMNAGFGVTFRAAGTPCSCSPCRGMRYGRLGFNRETERILRETWLDGQYA